jgi:ubiquinone/menaquinone biosynthesis C-methylase UbiE
MNNFFFFFFFIFPANTQFIQANILDGLPFENNEFDFVYIRALGLSFSETQWLESVYKNFL